MTWPTATALQTSPPPSPPPPPPLDPHTMALIRMAVREDMGHSTYGTVPGDRTVELAIPQELRGEAWIVARRPGVIAGTFLLAPILREYAVDIECQVERADGTLVRGAGKEGGGGNEGGERVATVRGPVRAMLSAERVLLNFLGHLSGIATLTRRYVEAVAQAVPEAARRPAVCDTRKTTPAYRALDKYAVRCGGGVNHRIGLYDGVMLKDNHLAALRERLGKEGTLGSLAAEIRATLERSVTLWVEVDTLQQLEGLLETGGREGADIVLLDNFSEEQMEAAVELRDSRAGKGVPLLEASGGITLENVGKIARTGIDRISIGALTHSAPVLDLSMEFQ